LVPGGWASDKFIALGDEGREQIRDYVRAGGSYLGYCGGAGLALSHDSGLALAPIGRVPTKVRLPSFSGGIALKPVDPGHAMWRGFPDGAVFNAWWPGQFALDGADNIEVLAVYGEPAAGSFVTDLPVLPNMDWNYWERIYGINLQPERIIGEPAVIETTFGEGKVLLSYLHFETPGDKDGHVVLLNILEYLAGVKPVVCGDNARAAGISVGNPPVDDEAVAIARDLKDAADRLISFGMDNYLWYRRNDWILQWRRGVRGVEYSTLYVMLNRLAAAVLVASPVKTAMLDQLRQLSVAVRPFFENAPKLLLLERDAMSEGPISPLRTEDPDIRALREKLFSNSRRCGGLYKEIVDQADEILLPLLKKMP